MTKTNHNNAAFHYGCLANSLKAQAMSQGLTLGTKAKAFQRIADSITSLHLNGYLRHKEAKKKRQKLHEEIMANVRPLAKKKQ